MKMTIVNKHEELERIHLSPQNQRKFVEKARSDVDEINKSSVLSEMENEIVDSITHSNKYRTNSHYH